MRVAPGAAYVQELGKNRAERDHKVPHSAERARLNAYDMGDLGLRVALAWDRSQTHERYVTARAERSARRVRCDLGKS